MGRKSRLKRERAASAQSLDPVEPTEPLAVVADIVESPASAEPLAESRKQRPRGKRPVGARLARVAVDDATREAFRRLCGSTPASIRLGQMVAAEVERACRTSTGADAASAVAAIRAHLDELEAFARGK